MHRLLFTVILIALPAVFAAAQQSAELSSVEAELADGDFKTRRKALNKLSGMQDQRKPELLKRAMADKDPEVRERSARLLAKSGDKTAYKTLTDALAAAGDETRLPLIDALGDLGDKRAAKTLGALLSHADRNTRLKSAEVLGRLKSDDGVEPLRKAAAEDKDELVRKAAVNSLAKTGTARARAALNALKAGKDAKTALWAGNALQTLPKK